ncbi:MAG: SPOR domain-containing protein [Thermodesulfovibrionales bacterium]
MKKTDLKEKSSVFYVSRTIIMISVIIISSIGFTLGFFVGKNFRSPADMHVSGNPQKEIAGQQTQQTPVAQIPVEIQKPQENKNAKEAQPIEKAQEMIPSQSILKAGESQETRKSTSSRKYTVQVGAFKNSSDAHALMLKLDKKGYHAAVIMKKAKNERIFKVLVGEFNTREEAEVFSIKLKKTEGLKAFVTFRTQQEALR